MPLNPNSDLVAEAWLAGVPGLSASMVSTTLPQDQSVWSTNGFVTVSVIGGSPDLYLPVRQPVIQVDCWAVNPNSPRPPWGKANSLAEAIRSHVEAGPGPGNHSRLLTFSQGDYRGAIVMAAIMRTEPRRAIAGGMMPNDGNSYARYLFDLELRWRVAS